MTVTSTTNNGVTTYSGSAASLKDASRSTLKEKSMGQMDFLKLLTAQMKSQDPFEPLNNAEMVSQMATITNSTGIAEMNATLKSLASSMSSSRIDGAASWIGHSMLVKSNIVAPDAAGQYAGEITLPNATDGMSVDLLDGNGGIVKTIDIGARGAGTVPFYWNGKDTDGNTVASSALQVRVRGASGTTTSTWASIAAVQSPADGSSARLITPLGSYQPSDALKLA